MCERYPAFVSFEIAFFCILVGFIVWTYRAVYVLSTLIRAPHIAQYTFTHTTRWMNLLGEQPFFIFFSLSLSLSLSFLFSQ